ncbi:MAG: hypothetical protein VYC39_10745 [Myxococcota bacterium]|nr:hypothetical protein [Myxococcota bacterium]
MPSWGQIHIKLLFTQICLDASQLRGTTSETTYRDGRWSFCALANLSQQLRPHHSTCWAMLLRVGVIRRVVAEARYNSSCRLRRF